MPAQRSRRLVNPSFITPAYSRRPLVVESVLNTALATILRDMRHTWDVVPEAKGSLQSKSKQPDMVITERGCDPVIIENEYAPAQTVEAEAMSRLGMVHADTNIKIRAVIALCTPARLKKMHWKSLTQSLRTATDFKYAVYTPDRYPSNGWLGGGVADIAMASQIVSISKENIDYYAERLTDSSYAIGKEIEGLSTSKQNSIAARLYQPAGSQT